MRLLSRFLEFFFHHLYHGFAFVYDFVAAVVSFGHWIEWTKATLPFLRGTSVLELGHGPGHLQRAFLERGLDAFGLDESSQMSRLARRRLLRSGYAQTNLARGLGQALPFAGESLDSIVATFPAPYIAEERTLSEARRVLRNGGRLIVLIAAWPKSRVLQWVYRVTGQSPAEGADILREKISRLFLHIGFIVETKIIEVKSASLLMIVAEKTME
jgi:ubiquinone/menaquinone biosynthesis C-methylase UbiE